MCRAIYGVTYAACASFYGLLGGIDPATSGSAYDPGSSTTIRVPQELGRRGDLSALGALRVAATTAPRRYRFQPK
jgi:hypothetical protein